MLDTFQGLPVHALVVHAVVVLVPLLALVTVVVAMVPRWRRAAAWYVVAADGGLLAVTYVAAQSGRLLQRRLGDSPPILAHVALGRRMVWFVLALAVSAVLVAVLRTARGWAARAVVALAALAAVASVVWVARVGHSGSAAVWTVIIRSTQPG